MKKISRLDGQFYRKLSNKQLKLKKALRYKIMPEYEGAKYVLKINISYQSILPLLLVSPFLPPAVALALRFFFQLP